MDIGDRQQANGAEPSYMRLPHEVAVLWQLDSTGLQVRLLAHSDEQFPRGKDRPEDSEGS